MWLILGHIKWCQNVGYCFGVWETRFGTTRWWEVEPGTWAEKPGTQAEKLWMCTLWNFLFQAPVRWFLEWPLLMCWTSGTTGLPSSHWEHLVVCEVGPATSHKPSGIQSQVILGEEQKLLELYWYLLCPHACLLCLMALSCPCNCGLTVHSSRTGERSK